MTATSQVLLALANPDQLQVVRMLMTAPAPLPVATLSTLLDRTPRDVRRLLRGLKRAGVIADYGGAVARTSAVDVALSAIWTDFEKTCCSGHLSHLLASCRTVSRGQISVDDSKPT